MQELKILKMSLRNFKAIKKLDADLSGNDIVITGTNGIGKTTVFDAFCWLLFGKDSRDRKDFEVKTLDSSNDAIHRLEHSAEAVISVDGINTHLKRVYKEKWVKKRGEATEELQGHTTDFYWNNVPLSLKEYQESVAKMVGDELRFKLLTNPLYFNEVMKWQDRRDVLIKIAGFVADSDVLDAIATLDNKARIADLTNVLNSGKNIEQYKAELNAKKKPIKEALAAIPSRIDEVDRNIPAEQDWRNIEESLKVTLHEIKNMQQKLSDSSLADRAWREKVDTLLRKQDGYKLELRKIIHRVSEEFFDVANKSKSEMQAQQRVLTNATDRMNAAISDMEFAKGQIAKIEKQVADKRNEWTVENEKVCNLEDITDTCPTCGQALPADQIESHKEELLAKFNEAKLQRLNGIRAEGKRLNGALEAEKKKLDELSSLVQNLSATVEAEQTALAALQQGMSETNTTAEPDATTHPDYIKVQAEIAAIDAEISAMKPVQGDDNSSETLMAEIAKYNQAADEMKARLLKRDAIQAGKSRIAELQADEKKFSQELADLEAVEFMIQKFEMEKMDMVETRVNRLFEKARFKMFNRLINGGTEATCELIHNGVPWFQINKAATIQLGLDCIKTLSRFYGITCPIFIDNAETVVTGLPDMNGAQIIRLVADATYNELTIQTKQ